MSRPPLVHVCPLPPRRNGIADYAMRILTRLAAHYQLVCVVPEPDTVDPYFHKIAQILSYADYNRAAHTLSGMRHLVHVGNNDDHVPVLDVLSQTPSVVVLHDLTLHYLMSCWAHDRLGGAEHMADIARLLHGGAAADMVVAKRQHKRPLQSIYGEVNGLPFFRDTARALITHSHYGHVMIRAAGVEAPVEVIPHFAEIPAHDIQTRQRSRWRNRIGADLQTTVFSSLGFMLPNKQIPLVLKALAALPWHLQNWRYVIGGEDRDPAVRATCKALGLESRVVLLDYLDDDEFNGVLAASDVLVNLRYPTSGETSGTVCRALANGVPCVVSDHGWYAELPDSVTYRVRPDPQDHADLGTALRIAMVDREGRLAKAAAARDYAAKALALDHVVDRYRAVIEQAYAVDSKRTERRAATIAPLAAQMLTFGPPMQGDADDSRRLEDVLLSALAAERAMVVDRPVTSRVLPGVFDLTSLGTEANAAHGPRQVFAALQIEDHLIGGLQTLLWDAGRQMRVGDLLTLGICTREADCDWQIPGRLAIQRQLHVADGLMALLQRSLTSVGFTVLREVDLSLHAVHGDDPYKQIIVMTVRKTTLAVPDLPQFLPTL